MYKSLRWMPSSEKIIVRASAMKIVLLFLIKALTGVSVDFSLDVKFVNEEFIATEPKKY